MVEFEKYENKYGEIAVLISPDFGAGWSTWADDDYQNFLLMDKRLVQMVMDKKSDEDFEEFLESLGVPYMSLASTYGLEIEWVPKGTAFHVREYDGSEMLQLIDDIKVVA